MFGSYLDTLRMYGRRHFTFQELIQDLSVSENSAKTGLYRLKKSHKIITPLKGLYVIVPPEHQPYGSIPAQDLIPIIMNHLKADYYVALLSAGMFYGVTHQKPRRFQVVTNQRIKHPLVFGQVAIELIYRKSLEGLPVQDFVVSTGYLKVASPEVVTLDLFKYSYRAGGINHLATVLSELTPQINEEQLIALAHQLGEIGSLQRLGFILEKIDVFEDETKKQRLIERMEAYLKDLKRPFIPLVPSLPTKGYPRCKKWRIIENTDFESDL